MAIKKWNAPDGFIPNQRFTHYGIKLPMRASESPIIPKGAAGMQRVADWLERLGLGQYEQRFAENDIGFVILPDLTDQDLEKIGIASLGHRRLLLRAIAELPGGEKKNLEGRR